VDYKRRGLDSGRPAAGHLARQLRGSGLGDFTEGANLSQASGFAGSAVGLYFRRQDSAADQHSYRLSIDSPDYWYLGEYVSGTFSWVNSASGWVQEPALCAGQGSVNHLQVQVSGSTITISMNDTTVEAVTDSDHFSGYIGLHA
jgi:hypothetical protein